MRVRKQNPFLPFLVLWALIVAFMLVPLEYHRWFVTPVNVALALTGATFLLFGMDKYQANRQGVRVPEVLLHLTVAFGGSIGALLGMHVFRHKTRKIEFQFAVILIILAQLGVAYVVLRTFDLV